MVSFGATAAGLLNIEASVDASCNKQGQREYVSSIFSLVCVFDAFWSSQNRMCVKIKQTLNNELRISYC